MDKIAVVTGATSGIGKAISEKLIKNDMRVLMNGRSFTDAYENDSTIQTKFDLLEKDAPRIMILPKGHRV